MLVKMPVRSVGILNICTLWILLRKIVYNISCWLKISSSWTFLLLKFTEVTSTQGSVYIKVSFQIPGLTSIPSTLTAKKFMKMKFSANKIYIYIYITIFLRRIQRVLYKYSKSQ